MRKVRLNAYAKLNLTLDITGREAGYHMLDSLVVTVGVCDRVTVAERKDGLVRVTMHGMGIPPEENRAQLAAEKFVARFHTNGVDIDICKNIPVGAGMGGSSADAAAVIAGMGRLFSVDSASCKSLADACGSDEGFLLTGGLARMRGRGEQVESLPFAEMHFLILAPEEGVSTAACYAEYDRLGCKRGFRTEEAARLLAAGDLPMAARLFGNDLYPAAASLSRGAEEAYRELLDLSPLGASMTGSGSAAFAVFGEEKLCAAAASRYRGKSRPILTKSVPQRKNARAPQRRRADE